MATSKLTLLFLLATMATISSSSSARQQSAEFITASCNTTSYPELCVSSLAKFASKIQESPLQIAQIATKVSITNLKSAASKASSLYNKALYSSANSTANSTSPAIKTLKALRDCTELLKDALDNTNYSLSELKKMNGTAAGTGNAWRLANVQTYMSAALTKEDTCTDGLVEMGAVVKTVSGKVGQAKQYTSNALGLVNRLRDSY